MFIISHGISPLSVVEQTNTNRVNSIKKKPRILILGELSSHKGFDLFAQICDRLCEIADVYLVGCGDSGYVFKHKSQVKIIARYHRKELPLLINDLDIDLGLLLSIWTETFSYTLSELMSMGIPTLTTNIGSFADRITEGVNGFLVNPNPEDIICKINFLFRDSGALESVRNHLVSFEHKSVDKMVIEYQEQLNSNLFNSRKMDTFSQSKISTDILNLEKSPVDLHSYHTEIVELRLLQAQLLNQLEYKEFYPNWKISKKRYEPLSKRSKIFSSVKHIFPDLWKFLRNLAIYLKVLY